MSLSVNELSAGYASKVLEKVSLKIAPGELVCLIGKSGTGKTTLLNNISERHSSIQRPETFALVTQENLLLEWRTALENVLLPHELKKNVTEEIIHKGHELLAAVGLIDSVGKVPSEMSGGMKQRVCLARGLIQEAELYLFDEPLSAVDFDLRIKLGRLIRNFIVNNQRAALFITHNLEEAISLGDRVLVLSGRPGKIVLEEKINIPESMRDPVALRAQPEFARLFKNLWEAL